MSDGTAPALDDARAVLAAAEALTAAAVARTADLTGRGERIDDHQVLVERVTYAATEVRVARSLVAAVTAHPKADAAFRDPALCAVAELCRSARDRLDPIAPDLGVAAAYDPEVAAALHRLGH